MIPLFADTAYDIGSAVGGLFVPVVIGGIILLIARGQDRSRRASAPGPAPAATAPPGWYDDPWRQARLRYWDGAVWTGYTAP